MEKCRRRRIWRVPASGGDSVQITRDGGSGSIASADGKWIYYTKNAPEIELFRISATANAENSDETPISKVNDEGFRNVWTTTKNGIYFIARAEHSPYKIKFYDFATEKISDVAEINKFNFLSFAGITASPDGKTLIIAQFDQNASSIILAEIKQ